MQHHIEEVAKVYLLWDNEHSEWYIDSANDDGHALDGYELGPIDTNCKCGDDLEHKGHLDVAAMHDLPSLRDLHEMIGAYLEVEEIKHQHVHIMTPKHPRNLSGGLRVDLRRILANTFGYTVDAPTVDDAIANLTPLLQSVDENAYQRGVARKAETVAGI